MNKLIIVTSSFFDFSKDEITIGGLQTYISDLCELARNNGVIDVKIIQFLDNSDSSNLVHRIIDGIQLIGYPMRIHPFKSKSQTSFDALYKEFNCVGSVFIIATDQLDIKSKENNVVTIQHGIAFDIPGSMIGGFWGKARFLQSLSKILRCIKNARRLHYSRNTVCVDYNYFNWFRTIDSLPEDKVMRVIPNHVKRTIRAEELVAKLDFKKDIKSVVFARRFVDYRGTSLFIKVIKKLFTNGYRISVTFAGDGPLKSAIEKLREEYPDYIHITHYISSESVQFHKLFDIAVVPTIFSEGTSLSLAEAMAAGCYPIASHVGGMTNMIIDGFNGSLAYPDENSLYSVLRSVLSMEQDDFNQVVRNAYNTAKTAFSKEKWDLAWFDFLDNLT